ncbi:MAG: hypothetical protein Fur0011_1720 [Candidatus Microgenomates bacterium]
MLNIFSKKQQLIFLGVFLISLTILTYSYLRPTPPQPLEDLSAINPGNTTKSQLSNLPSYHSKTQGDQELIFFGQNAPKKYSEAIIKNDLVIAYKKTDPSTFEFTNLAAYLSKYGQYQFETNTSFSEFGYSGFVFLKAGIVAVAHLKSQEVLEEWLIPKDASLELIESLFPSINQEEGH